MYAHRLTKAQRFYITFTLFLAVGLASGLPFLKPIQAANIGISLPASLCPLITTTSPSLNIVKNVQGTNGETIDLPLGSVITYTITLTNSGNSTATDVIVTDTLPVGITFGGWVIKNEAKYLPVSGTVTLPGGTVQLPDDTVAWGPFDLLTTTSQTIIFTTTINSSPDLYGKFITNTAHYTSVNAGFDSASAAISLEEDVHLYNVYLPLIEKCPSFSGNPTIVEQYPNGNTHTISPYTKVSVRYDRAVNPSPVRTTFVIQGMQTGTLNQVYKAHCADISLTPIQPFKPGELVRVSATKGAVNAMDGNPPLLPTVWQFRVAVGQGNDKGSGIFIDSGQSLRYPNTSDLDLGDLDGDGDLDVFAGNDAAKQKIWLNNGQGTFIINNQAFETAVPSSDVSLGDIDGDGDLDAFIANSYSYSNVWLNNGNATFSDGKQSFLCYNLTYIDVVELGDLDGDGDLDVFLGCYDQPNTILLNNGKGIFLPTGQAMGNSVTTDIALGDLDEDGDLDAFVANYGVMGHEPNRVWLNNGNGTFTDSGQSLGTSSTRAVHLGDLDGDGDLDAFVGNEYNSYNRVWLNNGHGVFTDSEQHLGSSSTQSVDLGDVDGDGDLDALVGNAYGGVTQIWLNDGTSSFVDSGQILGNKETRAVTLGDADADGDLDAFLGNYDQANKILLNRNQKNLSLKKTSNTNLATPGNTLTYTLSYINYGVMTATSVIITDALPAAIINPTYINSGAIITPTSASKYAWQIQNLAPNEGGTITITGLISPALHLGVTFTNTGVITSSIPETNINNTFSQAQVTLKGQVTSITPAPNSHNSSLDTNLTLHTSHPASQATINPQTFIVYGEFQGHLNGAFDSHDIMFTPARNLHPEELVQATLTKDVIVGGTSLGRSYVWQFRTAATSGSGTFIDSNQQLGNSISQKVTLGDLDGDGDLDAFVSNSSGSTSLANKVWFNNGNGLFTDSGQALGSSSSYGVALGDIDGDSDLDAFVANLGSGASSNTVWLNNGHGIFTDSGQNIGSSGSMAVDLGDVDGDGDLDAIVANAPIYNSNHSYHSTGKNYIWLNNGHGVFSDGVQMLSNTQSTDVALRDLDNDGDLDAFVTNTSNQPDEIWLNNGLGIFVNSGQRLGNFKSDAVSLGDIDNDGDLDAYVAIIGNADKVWLNNGAGLFYDSGQNLGDQNQYSSDVALTDIDSDGDLDAVVTTLRQQQIVIWINDGYGTFTDSGQTFNDVASLSVAIGDVDNDGDSDAFIRKL